MACCGEYDFEQEEKFWPTYAENCMLDFRQQACISISNALKTYINDGTVPLVFQDKATDVQIWLAARTTECMNALAAGDTSPYPDMMVDAIWQLPDSNAPWAPQLQNVSVEIIFGYVFSVNLPAAPETCESIHHNNDQVFTDQSSPPLINAYYVELDKAEGALVAPLYSGAPFRSAGDFASLATSCNAPYCSTASFSVGNNSDFAIDSMVLYANGPITATNGTHSVTITSARIELYQQAHGFATCIGGSCNYTVPAGGAHFIVVGESGGEVVTLALPNSTNIRANLTVNSALRGNSWMLDPFEIEYVDDSSETWTLTVNSSAWL